MSYYFCLMIEGSGSMPLTNGSRSGSRRPKNMWIRNTGVHSAKTSPVYCLAWRRRCPSKRTPTRRTLKNCTRPARTSTRIPTISRRLLSPSHILRLSAASGLCQVNCFPPNKNLDLITSVLQNRNRRTRNFLLSGTGTGTGTIINWNYKS